MKRGFVLTLGLALFAMGIGGLAGGPARAQGAPQCGDFPRISDLARKRAEAVQEAMKTKADRKQVCALMTSFVAAESNVIKFLEDNQTWCGVPAQAVAAAKASHEKSVKFRVAACNDDAPHPHTPTLSDAIKTPTVDSAANTKTGHGGTFDTLTGNPLAR